MRRVELPSRAIEHFGSTGFRHTRAARGDTFQVSAVELGVGEAVEWQEGEWHETRSLETSRLLLIEGVFE